ncbi:MULTISPECIES: malonate decarboxylase holo-[acyl-carrier-protein] synthase [unclassified Variovorax]|uniref:malonate decarboxylase holo-[acyl-carrier-protein] synthase n=1 Tax=unclassified Variovorax TaxID=663243 RepID=UPI003F46B631
MNLPALPPDARWPRHQLVRVDPHPWAALLGSREDLAGEPLLEGWAQRGWPLIVRRRMPGEAGWPPSWLAVGLPLPPSAGKRRIALKLQMADVASTAPLPGLRDVVSSAPLAWQPTLQALLAAAGRHEVHTRVFGSLAWQWLTGLPYLGHGSDIDLTWTLPRRARIDGFLAELAAIESAAPMRLDGELVRPDGAGVNWRELHAGADELLLKTTGDPALCSRNAFDEACP